MNNEINKFTYETLKINMSKILGDVVFSWMIVDEIDHMIWKAGNHITAPHRGFRLETLGM